MKRNIFILALVAMFVSATISAQTTETKKVETKKECCKSKDDKKACAGKKDKKRAIIKKLVAATKKRVLTKKTKKLVLTKKHVAAKKRNNFALTEIIKQKNGLPSNQGKSVFSFLSPLQGVKWQF